MSTQINSDPFARHSLMRETVISNCGCAWCGNQGKEVKSGFRLFRYFVEDHNYRKSPIKGLFCSVGCMRTYHGG